MRSCLTGIIACLKGAATGYTTTLGGAYAPMSPPRTRLFAKPPDAVVGRLRWWRAWNVLFTVLAGLLAIAVLATMGSLLGLAVIVLAALWGGGQVVQLTRRVREAERPPP